MSFYLSNEPKELSKKFFGLKTGRDIANLLEVKYNDLNWFLYRTNQNRRYSSFEIKKKNAYDLNSENVMLEVFKQA
jgi:hypothetical protein